MNTLKKVAIALTVVAVMGAPTIAGEMETGGNVPLINTIVGVGTLSLDFSGPGNLVNIATFIMSCNDANFHVNWTFANLAKFKTANGLQVIPMTAMQIVEGMATGTGGYIAGTGLLRTWIAGHPVTVFAAPGDASLTGNASVAGTVTWTDVQSTATVNDQIRLNASWNTSNTVLYGLYTEQITFVCVAD
jgi:hypothetical protein